MDWYRSAGGPAWWESDQHAETRAGENELEMRFHLVDSLVYLSYQAQDLGAKSRATERAPVIHESTEAVYHAWAEKVQEHTALQPQGFRQQSVPCWASSNVAASLVAGV
jgi:hypothetical protein